jgi:hypothetical protein
MNLLCPHCQKMVTVPEEKAGESMNCPSCHEAFTVPSLPQAPALTPILADLPEDIPLSPELFILDPPPKTTAAAPSDPDHEEGVYRIVPEPPKPAPPPPAPRREKNSNPPPAATPRAPQPSAGKAPATGLSAQPKPPPPPPPAGYTHASLHQVNPRAIPWIAPVALGVAFLLFFFPWTGLYPGGHALYTERGYQTIFGFYGSSELGEKALGEAKPFESVSSNGLLMFPFIVLIVAGLALSFEPVVSPHTTWKLPPALAQVWPWRLAILAGVTGVAFLFLLIQLAAGFGLENAVTATVNKNMESQIANAKTAEERDVVDIKRGLRIDQFHIERTVWLWLEVLALLAALAGIGLEFWLERRGSRPLPQLELRW